MREDNSGETGGEKLVEAHPADQPRG
jgi:hypothetical protein